MKTFLLLTIAFLFVITIYGQDTIMPTNYYLPKEFSKPLKWEKSENRNILNEQFYCSTDSLNIKNYNEAFNIIDTAKNFCNLYYTCYTYFLLYFS